MEYRKFETQARKWDASEIFVAIISRWRFDDCWIVYEISTVLNRCTFYDIIVILYELSATEWSLLEYYIDKYLWRIALLPSDHREHSLLHLYQLKNDRCFDVVFQ